MVSKTEWYKKCLEHFAKQSYSAESICLKLAKERPDLFCKYVDIADPIVQKIIDMGRGSEHPNFIMAIKEHRALTNMGLKESKDAVEKIWTENGIKW